MFETDSQRQKATFREFDKRLKKKNSFYENFERRRFFRGSFDASAVRAPTGEPPTAGGGDTGNDACRRAEMEKIGEADRFWQESIIEKRGVNNGNKRKLPKKRETVNLLLK